MLKFDFDRAADGGLVGKKLHEWLLYPSDKIWYYLDGLEEDIEAIESKCEESLLSDFHRFCFASYLLLPTEQRPTFRPIVQQFIPEPSQLGILFSLQELEKWPWKRISIALAGNEGNPKGKVVYAIIGMNDNVTTNTFCPDWCSSLLDDAAMQAVQDAFAFARRPSPSVSFFFFPILPSLHTENKSISGGSLGLPIYLGCDALIHNYPVPNKILATGILNPDSGTIAEVVGLDKKLIAAKDNYFTAFLYPCLTGIDPLISVQSVTVEKLPAESMQCAKRMWRMYVPGHGVEINKFLSMIENPEFLALNLPSIPSILIPLSNDVRKQFHESLQTLCLRNDHLAFRSLREYCNGLSAMLKSKDWPRDTVIDLLNLVPKELLDIIASKWKRSHPKTSGSGLAFDFGVLHIAVANHCGNIAASKYWLEATTAYFNTVKNLCEVDSERFLSLISGIIGLEHNAYRFTRQAGCTDTNELKKLLAEQERNMKRRKSRYGEEQVSYYLGCYYGTMMQHYAFCGPKYLKKSLDYSDKSVRAFSGGTDIFNNSECLRQYGYRVYAYLDAGDHESAENALLLYCSKDGDIKDCIDLIDTINLDDFQHAALTHYLAATGRPLPEYESVALCRIERLTFQHPNQLWLYNVGKLFSDRNIRKKFWLRSIDACFGLDWSVTIPIMALLPLSSLAHEKLCDAVELRPLAEKAIQAMHHKDIHQPHFQNLIDIKEWQEVLTQIYQNPAKYFPFSYR